ncbi:MAG: hybrid sensor histidine kinase/response regulator [Vicinamibacterales bacterium]
MMIDMGTRGPNEPAAFPELPRGPDNPLPFDDIDNLGPEELRQRLRSLQAILEAAPVPIAIAHDPDCRFISANRALAALLHVREEVNISLTPPAGMKPPYRIQRNGEDIPPAELPMQLAIARRAFVSNDIEILRADGTMAYIQNDVEPLYDTQGRVYGCVSVCVDMTDRRLAELALRAADRRKDEFLATLSHELRNPLAPLRSALEVMRLARDDPETIERARATMDRQLTHLVRITDDLLDVARITQSKMDLRRERIDLRAVLHSAIESSLSAIDARHHRLTIDLPDVPVWTHGDFTRLAQVFSNLLNNAAKYTDPGGRIHVSISTEGPAAKVTVADNGVGIPPAMLPAIFDMFTQIQRFRDRTQGGLGIGLTLAKRLVELHGGRIDAHSEGEGHGSRFHVTLPTIQPTPVHQERPSAERQPPLRACRVLIADDNPDTLEMMELMLTLQGHTVRVASDGVHALEAADEFRPQIAFLDIGMPRMDGYEAASRIRRLLGRRVVLVALTGWGQDEDKRRSREAGFDHHLTKPPDPELLDQLIAACPDVPSGEPHD